MFGYKRRSVSTARGTDCSWTWISNLPLAADNYLSCDSITSGEWRVISKRDTLTTRPRRPPPLKQTRALSRLMQQAATVVTWNIDESDITHTHTHTLIHLQITLTWHRANQSWLCPFSAKRSARKQPTQTQDWTRDLPKAGRTFWPLSYRCSNVVSNTWRRKYVGLTSFIRLYQLAHEPKYIVSRLSNAPDPWTCICA